VTPSIGDVYRFSAAFVEKKYWLPIAKKAILKNKIAKIKFFLIFWVCVQDFLNCHNNMIKI
jgi:hypothetical protein